MGMAKTTDSDYKSHLATEICNVSNRAAIGCAHRNHHHFSPSNRPPFVDWYLVLRVDENAGLDIIRKSYLGLALQLHPDKNKHPKADIAFKLVSEAYACLSDNVRRTSFNGERQERKNLCAHCSNATELTRDPPSPSRNTKLTGKSKLRIRSINMMQRMKDLRARFEEEANVIENCLKANAASRISVSSRKELPTFNPTDYLSQGYPHLTAINHGKMESLQRSLSKNHGIQTLSVKP